MLISPVTGGLLGYGLVTGGYAGSGGTPLLITMELHSSLLATSPSPTPWSIDPERTVELTEATSPDPDPWSSEFSSVRITTSPSPTPWSIDPERTVDMNAS